jgi:hypothetical protein
MQEDQEHIGVMLCMLAAVVALVVFSLLMGWI